MAPLQNASAFLIHSIFDLYLFILLLRFILQYLRVDYYNPFTQFVVKATSPIVVPLRRIVPGFYGIDFATIIAIVVLTGVKISLIMFISMHKFPAIAGLLIWSFGEIFALTINLFFYAILMTVILSWVAPMSNSPITPILYRLTEPLMRPVRRLIPPIGGFDITPIPVMITLQLLKILIADPLTQMGFQFGLR
ncbi:MAG: YggT family protein [Gammaproteobacteria bacterium]|jgi:YggT family protein|nr:YggT family protein [Gammaproteobacteria bacterium]